MKAAIALLADFETQNAARRLVYRLNQLDPGMEFFG